MISELKINDGGSFSYTRDDGMGASASFPLFLLRRAWDKGCSFEDLADGFMPLFKGTRGDWSGIRDSSSEAIEKMVEKALNFLFGDW